jgi:hypothetical protein
MVIDTMAFGLPSRAALSQLSCSVCLGVLGCPPPGVLPDDLWCLPGPLGCPSSSKEA